MSKKLHEIAKKLKRETTVVNSNSTAMQSTQPLPTTSKMRERTTPWLLIEALHQGQTKAADAIINKSELTETEKLLLKGMRAAWAEEATQAEQILGRAAGQLVGISRCWAHLELAQLFLDLGKDDQADYHLSRARRYSYEDRQDRQCLTIMVDLIDARADIERGAHQRAHNTINSLLADCSDGYLKGIAFYLLGCLGRFREGASASDRSENLREAINIFESQSTDRYYLALSRLEMSHCAADLKTAEEMARSAGAELSALGRVREAKAAQARAAELAGELANSRAGADSDNHERIGQCLFISASMRAMRLKLDAIAGAERDPVLILGPRGSGKEMIAQSIHALSPRRQKSMLAINCGALPEQLVESELFGYEKGAFTGAATQKKGLFELADGGTLLLDEIGELAPSAQAKLLRVLQTGRFRRLGGTAEIVTDVRIIAATNRDIDEMAGVGTFRADLLDRLSVWRLRIPPLSKRREEILPLAEEFLERYGEGKYRLDNNAKKFLLEKDYPGNVRILENDIRRSIGNARAAGTDLITAPMILEDYDPSMPDSLNPVNKTDSTARTFSIDEIPNYDEAMLNFERELLIRALAACQWNKKLAAVALGMSERTFWRAVQRHRLHTRPE
jgi:two-component system, NtrC family, response regulator AtoC